MGPAIWDVVVVGAVNSDYLGRGPALPTPGSTVDGDAFQAEPGGKGANQAVAAARLGARVALIARVGDDDRGAALVAATAAAGIDVSRVSRDPDAATGAALIQVGGDGEKQILSVPGANHRLTADDVRAAPSVIEQARVLLAPLETPLAAVAEAARLARQAGAPVVLDPAPPAPLPDDFRRFVDVIKPNASEADALTGIRPHDRDTARAAAALTMTKLGAQAGLPDRAAVLALLALVSGASSPESGAIAR